VDGGGVAAAADFEEVWQFDLHGVRFVMTHKVNVEDGPGDEAFAMDQE